MLAGGTAQLFAPFTSLTSLLLPWPVVRPYLPDLVHGPS